MSVPTAYLPLPFQRTLLQGEFSVYDLNQNLYCHPIAGAIAGCQAATFGAFASATRTVTGGPDVGALTGSQTAAQLIELCYNGVYWWMLPNTPTKVPNFIFSILTTSDASLVWTVS